MAEFPLMNYPNPIFFYSSQRPKVPLATITPVKDERYLHRNITSKEINPSVTTVALTIPVLAAKIAPTTQMDIANPPCISPNALPINHA